MGRGKIISLSLISLVAGTVLIAVLYTVWQLTGNTAFFLLFNFEYIPVLGRLQSAVTGILFHYITCFVSVILLYYFLKRFCLEGRLWIYTAVYTIGGGILFFLTALSPRPPAADDVAAWIYWTIGHGVYGLVVAALIGRMVISPALKS